MKRVAGQVDGSHTEIGDLDAFGIFVFVELSAHLEAGFGCRRGDQLNDRAIAAQRFASPVDRGEREETVLDLVPFAGAGWQVTHRDGKFEFVRQLLKLDFPETYTMPVAAAAIGGDHPKVWFGVTLLFPRFPPSSGLRVRKHGGGWTLATA